MTKLGGDNYADCDGTYVLEESKGTLNSKPVYVNWRKHRLLAAFVEDGWGITDLSYLEELLASQPRHFAVFHHGGASEPQEGEWENYRVAMKKQLRGSLAQFRAQAPNTGDIAIIILEAVLCGVAVALCAGVCDGLVSALACWKAAGAAQSRGCQQSKSAEDTKPFPAPPGPIPVTVGVPVMSNNLSV